MGKLSSLIAGFLAVCLLSYYVLSAYFSGLISWVGPLAGPQIMYALGFLILFFGNPVYFPMVAVSWIVAGFVVAMLSRKGLKSAGAAVSLFFLTLGFFGTVAASMIIPIVSGTSSITTSFSSIPPPPRGTSILSVTSAPVLGSVITFFENFLSGINFSFLPVSGTGNSTTGMPSLSLSSIPIAELAYSFILPLVANLVIFAVAAGIFGAALGSLSKRKPSGSGTKRTAVIAILIAMFMVASSSIAIELNHTQEAGTGSVQDAGTSYANALVGSFGNLGFSTASSTIDPYYEAAASYVSSTGSVLNFYAFARSFNGTAVTSQFLNSTSVQNSAFSLLMDSSGLSSFISGSGLLGGSGFLNSIGNSSLSGLIPHLLLISIIPGDLSSGQSSFSSLRSQTESAMGIHLSRILEYSLGNLSSGTLNIFIYGSNSIASPDSSFSNYSLNGFSSSNMFSMFTGAISSGKFNAGAGSISGSILFSVFLNTEYANSLINTGMFTGNIAGSSGKLAIVGGSTVADHRFHSSSSFHNITLAQTLGYSGSIHLDAESSGSALLLGAPVVTGPSPSGKLYSRFSGYVSNTAVLGMLPFSVSSINEINYTASSGISPASIYVGSNWTYPYNLSVNVSMKVIAGGYVRAATTIVNHENRTVGSITVDESSFTRYYGAGIENLSGGTSHLISSLNSGSSSTFNFTFRPRGIGTYAIPFANVSYSEYISSLGADRQVNVSYTGAEINISAPDFATVANNVEFTGLTAISGYVPALSFLVIPLLSGFYVFDLIVVLIIVLDVWLEIRAHRKRKDAIRRTIEL